MSQTFPTTSDTQAESLDVLRPPFDPNLKHPKELLGLADDLDVQLAPAAKFQETGSWASPRRSATLATSMAYSSVEYRLAPEYQAPAGLDDCYNGLVWVSKHASELGINPDQLLVYGCSGGGPLAAASVLLARQQQSPPIRAQMLVCPILDDRDNTVSAKQFEHGTVWCGKMNRQAWDLVIGRNMRGSHHVTELIAPARATNLKDLPPTFIDAGECEVFRDEAVAYASKLWEAGVSAELHIWQGGYHGFDQLQPESSIAQASKAAKKAWISRLFRNI
ncbi:alpha/beta hydrolase fold domain-containing protein [Trichoderma evansii]